MNELSAFFFFSSRRRHTRSLRDWSSDVCSSDLQLRVRVDARMQQLVERRGIDSGDRFLAAALKAAVGMVDEGLISREEAVARIDPASLDQLLHPRIDPNDAGSILATASSR